MSQGKCDQFSSTYQSRKPKPEGLTRRCHLCMGTGMAPCPVCIGKGEVLMGRDFNGRAQYTPCQGCFGKKTLRCRNCNGIGCYDLLLIPKTKLANTSIWQQ